MCDLEEEKYWQGFIDGDLDALSAIFTHYVSGLMAYGMRICSQEELVKDSIQEVFIQLIQKRHKLNLNENVKGLVYRMLRNKLIDELKLNNRSHQIDQLLFSADAGIERDAEYNQICTEDENSRNSTLMSALDHLSDYQKEAMFLKFTNGFNYEQISAILGISVASARTLIYRTIKQLKLLLIEK